MTDVHSKETRSYNMSRIRAKDTKPELLVRKYLFSKGFRYRLNVKKLPGKPDIVFTKYKTVIFINGCFWHGHEDCPKAHIPKTKTEWWKAKITRNQERDRQEYAALKQQGWRVLVIWECQLVPKKRAQTLLALEGALSRQILDTYRKPQPYIPAETSLPQVAEPETPYGTGKDITD